MNHLSVNSLVDHLINYVKSIIKHSYSLVIIVGQSFPMPDHSSRHNITNINEALFAPCDALNQFPSVVAGHPTT